MNKKINIFIVGSNNFVNSISKYLVPINVGIKNTSKDSITDSTGDNISYLNPYFCELTAHYWAWKNVDCEYYGFFHYRRYLSLNFKKKYKTINNIYHETIISNFDQNDLIENGLDDDAIESSVKKYDIILPKIANLKREKRSLNTVYKQFCNNDFHEKEDLEKISEIIKKEYPEFLKFYNRVFNGNKTYFYNMFIMNKKIFNNYMSWLFDILIEFHENKDYTLTSKTNMRTCGFIAERLLTVYIEYIRENEPKIKIKETQFIKINNNFNEISIKRKYKNKNVICMSSNDLCCKQAAITITSIVENNKGFLNFLILSDNISEINKKIIESFLNNNHNVSYEFFEISNYLSKYNLSSKNRITTTTYGRFLIFDLLKDSKKVIYLDSDVVVNFDINTLFEMDLNNKSLGAVRDTNYIGTCYNKNSSDYALYNKNANEILNLNSINNYFNAGVLIFDMKRCKSINSNLLFELAESKQWLWLDQDILNYYFKNSVTLLDNQYNFMVGNIWSGAKRNEVFLPLNLYNEYLKAKNNAFIIHYAGKKQPIYFSYPDYGDIYWYYARKSPFYEELLKELFNNKKDFKLKSFIKKIFPANSFLGNYLRKFYWFLRK